MRTLFNYKTSFLIAFVLNLAFYNAQEIIISNSDITSCSFTFYDTGGVNASGYSANQDFTTTICPDDPSKAIVMTWFTFTLGAGDYMKVYDGNSTAAPLLGQYTNDDLNNITAYASINNPSGCLTLHFVSNGTDNGVFNASVKCEIPCAYPNAGISSPTTGLMQVCKGTTLNFDGAASVPQTGFSISEYQWDFGDMTTESNPTTTTSHTFNETGRYIVSLEVKDNNGCKNKNAAFVEVIVETDPIYTFETVDVCEGEIFCLPASVSSPPLPAPENDLFGQGIHIPDDVGSCFQATQFFNVFPVGSHLTNINDLESIYAKMGHTYIGDLIISIICPSGQSVIMHQQGGGGSDLGGDYYWSPTTTNPTWAGAGGGSMLPPGTYASLQPLTGLLGCELNGTWTLQVCDMWASDKGDIFGWGVNLNPDLYVDLEALSPTIGLDSDSSIVSGPGMTSISSDGNTLCAQQFISGVYDYTYTVTNSFGCTHDTTITVTVKPGPVASFDLDSICLETEANFTNQTSGTVSLFNFTWNFGDGSPVATTFDAQHFYTNVGTYPVTLFADAGNGCIHDTTLVIEVYADAVADFNVLDDCLYNAANFTDLSFVSDGTIAKWNWNFGEMLPVTVIESQVPNPTYQYNQDGSYVVTLIVETDKGCHDTITKTTVRHPTPQVDFSMNPECEYDSIQFQNLTTINAPDLLTNYIWNYGDGSAFSSSIVKNHLYQHHGSYLVTLIATSNNGCIKDTSKTITIYPKPIANFSNNTNCENGEATSFVNLASVATGSIVAWDWEFNSTAGGSSTLPNPFYNYNQYGVYPVQLIVETNHGCLDTIEQQVTVLAKPTTDFIASITEACHPYCTDFSDLSLSNATSIAWTNWQFETEDESISPNPTVCFDNLGHYNNETFDVTLITRNDLGCYDTLTKEDYITVWPKPLASFKAQPNKVTMYDALIEFENNSEGTTTYEWDFGDGRTSQDFEPTNLYSDTGHYSVNLIITTQYGCIDSTRESVIIDPVLSVYIPNTFTPNGDGDNDDFFVKGFTISQDNFEFMIFDRWGTLIYYTDSFNPWDGTYKGQPAQQDVYTYVIQLKDAFGKNHSYKGHVNLIR